MVQKRKTLIWSDEAIKNIQCIARFYNERNQSDAYSYILVKEFIATMRQVALMPYIGRQTIDKFVRCMFVRDYKIYYEVKAKSVEVLFVWDTRRNPKNNPVEKR